MDNIKIKKIKKSAAGFSMIEMVVATGLIAMLSLVLSNVLSKGMQAYRAGQQTIQSQEDAARVMREFESSTRAATEVLTANANELAFYRYFDAEAAYPTKVRYFIDGMQFKVGLTEPAGVAPSITYPAGNETIDFLVDDLTDTELIFSYYDGDNQILNQPVILSNINMVELNISIDQNGSKPPGPVEEITRVSLRNKKTNL